MSDNVIDFHGITTVDELPELVLEKAKLWGMEHCVIIGHDGDGLLQFGSSTSSAKEILFLLERAKHFILTQFGETP